MANAPDNHDAAAALAPVERSAQILVVDDDESNRESLRRRLARHGYEVVAAADGFTALELMEKHAFDLVLLDVMMPGMSGLEVLGRVRETRSHTELPIIMATAQDESGDVVKALDSGANDYVTKPLEFAVVLARVRTQLLLKKSVDLAVKLKQSLIARNVDLETANNALKLHAKRAALELEAAARVQKSFLPCRSQQIVGTSFAWAFEPCQELAGDSLNILQLDADHSAFYILDVSGHGVAASLLAVAATRSLSELGQGESIIVETRDGVVMPVNPSAVATRLNKNFESNPETGQFITLFYAVFSSKTRMLTYVSAGHPPAILVSRDQSPRGLESTGLPIGFGIEYEQKTIQLKSGDRIYIYSDGVSEARNGSGDFFGDARLASLFQDRLDSTLATSIASLESELLGWHGSEVSKDDISVLGMECL